MAKILLSFLMVDERTYQFDKLGKLSRFEWRGQVSRVYLGLTEGGVVVTRYKKK